MVLSSRYLAGTTALMTFSLRSAYEQDKLAADLKEKVMLSGDDDGVHAEGGEGAVGVLLVLDGHLGLAVGAEHRERAVLAHHGQLVPDASGERVGEGHELGGLVRGVAEHV